MNAPHASTNFDQAELDKFAALANRWWDADGPQKPLHALNPVRLKYVADRVTLRGARVLDIGCGGGLLCEPMARLGAAVVGADASETNIEVAKIHAAQSGLDIDYRATTAEALAEAGEQFDIVLNMEVVEHVADVELYLTACAQMVKPGGVTFVATINRTLKALGLAIFGAEYVLRWLPRGTHQYEKLVRPEELEGPLTQAGLEITEKVGVTYNPLADSWNRSTDTDVNYMVLAIRP